MKSPQSPGLVPSFSVQAPMFMFYFPTLVYMQKMLRRVWTYVQAHVIFYVTYRICT